MNWTFDLVSFAYGCVAMFVLIAVMGAIGIGAKQ